jgi:hypothetical protein
LREGLSILLSYYDKENKKDRYLCFVGLKELGDNKEYFNYIKELFKYEKFELKYFYVDYKKGILIEDN